MAYTGSQGVLPIEDQLPIEQLHVMSQTLHNHFRVAKEVCQHMHLTRSVVAVDATKHVQLPISSESTVLVVLQWFNRIARTIAQREMLRRPVRAGVPFYRLLR